MRDIMVHSAISTSGRHGQRYGFTLTELIVVIAVIALLATLIVAGVNKAVKSAQTTKCASNLRQIAGGVLAYASDHSQKLPPAMAVSGEGQEGTWGYKVWPYIYGSYDTYKYPDNCLQMGTPVYDVCIENVFRCPSTRNEMIAAPGVERAPRRARYSYGLNDYPARVAGSTAARPEVPIMDIYRLSSTAMVVECCYPLGSHSGYYTLFGLTPHNGGSNVLYYDGHVEWLSSEDMPKDSSDVFWSGR